MQTELIPTGQADEQAVEAVRRGDAERYQELVERHERRVYGVVWSRLGDPAPAEEAAQETFIRAYRRLGLLGEGAKFGAWVASIARHVAINLGLRHRRELNKRERWALEETGATDEGSGSDTSELCAPETLRQALAELPPVHRECLVLFYIEGRSGNEAAVALDISEAAFRVRLSRARAALRERLEERLGESLAQLKPSKPLVAGVMVTVLATARAEAATTGVAIKGLPVLAKILPFKWLLPCVWLMGMLPGLAVSWWLGGMERENYRDSDGFRSRLHRHFFKSMFWVLPVIFLVGWLAAYAGIKAWGFRQVLLVLGIFSLGLVGVALRSLAINRSRFQAGMLVYMLILTAGELLPGLGLISTDWFNAFNGLAILVMVIVHGGRPQRMDYSLFLRAAHGMLPPREEPGEETAIRLPQTALRLFARFLGERWLIINYRWDSRELTLRLPAAKPSFGKNFAGLFFFRNGPCSRITLRSDGSVGAICGSADEEALISMQGRNLPERMEMESQVAEAVEAAWQLFRHGKLVEAERALGTVPEAEIFVVPTAKARATKWVRWLLGASVALTMVATWLIWRPPAYLHGPKPVSITESEVRATLVSFASGKNDPNLSYGLYSSFVLPPTNLFAPDALPLFREKLFPIVGIEARSTNNLNLLSRNHAPLLDKALVAGWLNWDDVGVAPAQVTQALRGLPVQNWPVELMRRKCTVEGKEFIVERMDRQTLTRLRWLQALGCLNIVDRVKLIAQLRSAQILSGDAPSGQPPVQDWRNVRGLFFTPGWPALEDTYCHLAALEILGGLSGIDREACLDAILQRHRGQGLFAPAGRNSGESVLGDAHDAFCAFESLRILGALDRVTDLESWQFRVHQTSQPGVSGEPRLVTWEEIEAWLCRQRLERGLRERQQNPRGPMRSLLEP